MTRAGWDVGAERGGSALEGMETFYRGAQGGEGLEGDLLTAF